MNSIFEQLNKLKDEFKWLNELKNNAKCFVPNCICESIDSHSVSKIQVLSLISEKRKGGDYIYKLQDKPLIDYEEKHLSTFQKKHRELELVDKSKASVFRGYCYTHDSLFNLIDNNKFDNTELTRFLHSTRTLSYGLVETEQLMKQMYDRLIPQLEKIESLDLSQFSSLNLVLDKVPDNCVIGYFEYIQIQAGLFELVNNNINRNELKGILSYFDKSKFPMNGKVFKEKLSVILLQIFIKIEHLSELFSELKLGRSLFERNKSFTVNLTKALKEMNTSFINTRSFQLDNCFLIAGSCNVEIENKPFALTFFPEQKPERTIFILGSVLNEEKVDRIYSKLNIMTVNELSYLFSYIILSQASNVFLSPFYYSKLTDSLKQKLTSNKTRNLVTQESLFDNKYGLNI